MRFPPAQRGLLTGISFTMRPAAMVLAFAGTVLGLRGALVRSCGLVPHTCQEHRGSVDRRKPKIRIHSYIAATMISADRGRIAHAGVAGTLSSRRKRISGKGQARSPWLDR